MTASDPLLPVPEDDAIDAAASAVVDGAASPEEAAAVAAAPDGAARVAALRAVAEAVGSYVGAQRPGPADRARAAALAAFDARGGAEVDAEAAPRAAEAPVTRLAPGAADRSRRLARIGTVAAALLLLVGIGAFATAVLSSDDDSRETSTAAAPARDSQAERSGAGALNAQDPSFTGPATSPPLADKGKEVPAPAVAPAPAVGTADQPQPPVVNGGDLGRQDDVEVLAQRAAAALDGVPDATVAAADAALPREIQACSAGGGAAANEPVTALRYRAVGTFRGTPAVFVAYDRFGTPPRVLLVLARADCSVLASSHF